MVRKFLRRRLPKQHHIQKDKILRIFGALLHNPDLWHLNRNSAALAVSVGLFLAFVPIPFQMVLAAAAAIALGCNLPIAVAMVWVSNPVTIPPLFFAAYRVGASLLHITPKTIEFELSLSWLWSEIGLIWQPLLLGCFVLGLASAALGNVLTRVLWRLHVVQRWRQRKQKRLDISVNKEPVADEQLERPFSGPN